MKIITVLWMIAVFVSVPIPLLAAEVLVYKSPYCGCCSQWSEHMRSAGHTVTEKKVDDVQAYKSKLGVPPAMASCHTGLVAGYFIEGHVPAADVARMLKERPDIRGLAVPGMPAGSPGMEMSGQQEKYDTLAVRKDGSTYVFASH